MFPIILATGVTVVVAAAVVVFVAYPSRGRSIPRADWLNHAVNKAADRLPADLAQQFVRGRR